MRILLILALSLLLAAPARAGEAADIAAVEAYLGGLSTMQARFIQTDAKGRQAAGDFMLKRPGRVRFQYDLPLKDFIVANGLFIYYYDGRLHQQSHTLISRSPADFFLRKDLKLSGDVRVTKVERGGGLLQVTLEEDGQEGTGALTIGLTENPLALKKWRIADARGAVTEIELFDVKTGVAFDSDLFRYIDPRPAQPHYN